MIRNPRVKVWRQLGKTALEWQAIKDALLAHFDANDDKAELPDAQVRAVHAALADDRVWAEVKRELGT